MSWQETPDCPAHGVERMQRINYADKHYICLKCRGHWYKGEWVDSADWDNWLAEGEEA